MGWAHVLLIGEYLWPNGEKLRVSFRPQPEPTPLTGTNRMLGRVTASQIAAASAASFLPRFPYIL
ncbi:hypothetical protein ALP59_02599 [Pseudomonas savastanoi]|uniref:Uncharacterized protein n=1 Tax=Pseudomonas savastanoi TaxID=29438 RepID=A0A3M5FZ23_PSESS|nr:hypothetical protein ALP59_02599 [Pseudomonas savastanoi]